MREKLLDLMKNEGLKPSQLAELLEINPAGISHILAGRNKPGFDLLQKILRRFPRINPDWLLLDSNQMYRNESAPQSSAQQLASNPTLIGSNLFNQKSSGIQSSGENRQSDGTGNQSDGNDSAPQAAAALLANTTNVKRIVVLYEDQTFESFTPTKR